MTSPDYQLLRREFGDLRSPPVPPTSDDGDTPTYAHLSSEPYSDHLRAPTYAEPYEEHVPAYAEPYEVGHVIIVDLRGGGNNICTIY